MNKQSEMRKGNRVEVSPFLSNCKSKKEAVFQKRLKLLALVSIFFLLSFPNPTIAQDFKVIGYLPSYRFHLNEKIEYHKMTHLCISFANPDQYGNFSFADNEDPTEVIRDAHAAGVKVFLSLAGGAQEPEWRRAWAKFQQPYYRQGFIQKIVDYALKLNVQGIDVDLEWDDVGPFYNDFVMELGRTLQFYNLKMTAALPGIHRYPQISDAALQSFDWINIMAYDLTGPWNPSRAGQHAPFSMAIESIEYWTRQNVPAEKLTLGVPFYGFDFSNRKKVISASFGDLTKRNRNLAQVDQVGKTYYNGIPTIKAKTALAMGKVGGVMIWEIGQDCFNGNSLLGAIYEEKLLRQPESEELLVEEVVEKEEKIIEEPFPDEKTNTDKPMVMDGEATLTKYDSWEVLPAEGRFVIVDLLGRELYSQTLGTSKTLKVNSGFLLNGFDFAKLIEEGALLSQKPQEN